MKKKIILTSTFVSALALTSSMVVSAEAATTTKTVTIAFQGAITGNNAEIGNDQLLGAKTAVAIYNQSKPKIKVKLVVIDDQCDPALAGSVAQGVVTRPEIIGVVGPICSGAAKASFPAYKAGKMPLVSTAAAVPALTDPSDAGNGIPIFHRMVLNDTYQGPALTEWGIKDVKNPQIFVADDATPYGKSLTTLVSTYIDMKQYTKVGYDSIPSKSVDFSASVAKVLDSQANVVLFAGYYSDSGHFLKALREGGYTGIYAASAGSAIPAFIKEAGAENAEGARMTLQENPFENVATKSQMAAFKVLSEGKSVVGKQYVTEAYNAANVLLTLIGKGATTRKAIMDRIGKETYVGVGNTKLSFDAYGDIVGGAPFARWTVLNGKLKYLQEAKEAPIKKKK